ncbi:MAG: flagellar hook-length control protein FliK [Sandaracinaceae bacterium]|nr:flagellar hook-length control protein FliK [Sandaracinaceae bacterium]
MRAGCEAAAPAPTPSTGEGTSPSVPQSASPGAEVPVEERIEEGASPRDHADQDRGHESEDPAQPRPVEQLATTSLVLEPSAPASEAARESQDVAPSAPSPGPNRSEPSDVRWTLLRDVDGDRARVEFEHPELGAIRLELSLGDAGVDVEVLAPALWSAVAIKRSEQELRETLRAHGVRLAGLRIAREDDSTDEEALLRPLRGVLSTEA